MNLESGFDAESNAIDFVRFPFESASNPDSSRNLCSRSESEVESRPYMQKGSQWVYPPPRVPYSKYDLANRFLFFYELRIKETNGKKSANFYSKMQKHKKNSRVKMKFWYKKVFNQFFLPFLPLQYFPLVPIQIRFRSASPPPPSAILFFPPPTVQRRIPK